MNKKLLVVSGTIAVAVIGYFVWRAREQFIGEFFDGGSSPDFVVYGDRQRSQTFQVGLVSTNTDFTIHAIDVFLQKNGTPGDVTCELYLVDVDNKPTGPALSVGTIPGDVIIEHSWNVFKMTPYRCLEDTRYAFVLRQTATESNNNVITWGTDQDKGDLYYGFPDLNPWIHNSFDGGMTWNPEYERSINFRIR